MAFPLFLSFTQLFWPHGLLLGGAVTNLMVYLAQSQVQSACLVGMWAIARCFLLAKSPRHRGVRPYARGHSHYWWQSWVYGVSLRYGFPQKLGSKSSFCSFLNVVKSFSHSDSEKVLEPDWLVSTPVWPSANYLTSLCICFMICKMGIIVS